MGTAQSDVQLENFGSIFNLEGKVAVVTGGSRGLGLHAASGLLQAGCSKVYITARKATGCDEAVAALNSLPNLRPGAQAISVPADSSKLDEIERLVAEISRTTDHVDILFANAAATWGASFENSPPEAFAKVMNLNVQSIFYTVQKMAPLLLKMATLDEPSRVIVTASVAGIRPGTLGENATYAYSVSKAAAIHLVKNLAVDLGPRGILTNAIAPGFYPSKMANGLMEASGGTKLLASNTPNKRLGRPEDIAGAVVFLSSRASAHLNGTTVVTDGGAHLTSPKL